MNLKNIFVKLCSLKSFIYFEKGSLLINQSLLPLSIFQKKFEFMNKLPFRSKLIFKGIFNRLIGNVIKYTDE